MLTSVLGKEQTEMTTTQHTPQTATENNTLDFDPGDFSAGTLVGGYLLTTSDAKLNALPLTQVGDFTDFESLEKRGKIFAAAPDLLAALKAALPLVEGFDDHDHVDEGEEPIVAPVLAQIRAAIAKAEGR
jgi:hypothetical protein